MFTYSRSYHMKMAVIRTNCNHGLFEKIASIGEINSLGTRFDVKVADAEAGVIILYERGKVPIEPFTLRVIGRHVACMLRNAQEALTIIPQVGHLALDSYLLEADSPAKFLHILEELRAVA
jgi:hypothetical protein